MRIFCTGGTMTYKLSILDAWDQYSIDAVRLTCYLPLLLYDDGIPKMILFVDIWVCETLEESEYAIRYHLKSSLKFYTSVLKHNKCMLQSKYFEKLSNAL